MNTSTRPSFRQNAGSPELWLTPVIGLLLLGPLIYHWRIPFAEIPGPAFAGDWRMHLRANIGLDIGISIVPLFTTAALQRLFRAWKWHGWVRVPATGLIGGLTVCVFYYYALYPLSHWGKPRDEGAADVTAIFLDHLFALAILGAFAVFASVTATSVLTARLRKP